MIFSEWYYKKRNGLYGLYSSTVIVLDGIAPALLRGVMKFDELEFLVGVSGGQKLDKKNARKIWHEYVDSC